MADLISELGIDRQKLSMVKVTNRNGFVMRDRFDGNPYVFRPNQPAIIPPDAARHFFNWPGDPELMKAYTTRRFGWNRPDHVGADKDKHIDDMFSEGQTLADRYWENLTIEDIHYTVVPEDLNMPEKEDVSDVGVKSHTMPVIDELTHVGVGRKGRKLDL